MKSSIMNIIKSTRSNHEVFRKFAVMSCCDQLCTLRIELFNKMPLDLQQDIVKQVIKQQYSSQDIIAKEGDPLAGVLVIRAGKVKLSRHDATGRERIIDILPEGEIIGEDFFWRDKLDYNIVALSPVSTCLIPKAEVYRLASERWVFARALLDSLSHKIYRANEHISLLMENDAKKRVAAFLLSRVERSDEMVISLTLDDLAASTNLRKETVSRKLSELQSEKVLSRTGRGQIEIVNPAALSQILFNTG